MTNEDEEKDLWAEHEAQETAKGVADRAQREKAGWDNFNALQLIENYLIEKELLFITEEGDAMAAARNVIASLERLQAQRVPDGLIAAAPTPVPEQHPDDQAVDRFAGHMKWKLGVARERGKSGWQDRSWTPEQISTALRQHVEKGDPVDVANYCMFLAARGEPIIPAPSQPERKPMPDRAIDSICGRSKPASAWPFPSSERKPMTQADANAICEKHGTYWLRIIRAVEAFHGITGEKT